MESTFLLNVIVRQGAAIFQLLAREDEPLLIRWDAFLVLDLSLDVVDSVTCFHVECNCLPSERLYEDLHPAAQTQNQMESTFLLNVVVRQGAAIFQLLAREDETLLIRWDAFLVLDLSFDVVNSVTCFHVECNCLPSKGL